MVLGPPADGIGFPVARRRHGHLVTAPKCAWILLRFGASSGPAPRILPPPQMINILQSTPAEEIVFNPDGTWALLNGKTVRGVPGPPHVVALSFLSPSTVSPRQIHAG